MNIQKEFKLYQIELGSFVVPARIVRIHDIEDLESELAVFAKDRSSVTKVQFDDFLLSTFVTNIGSIMFFAVNRKITDVDFDDIREELIDLVLEVNPELQPSSLIVNVFGVIKIDNGKIVGTPLDETPFWDKGNIHDALIRPSFMGAAADNAASVHNKDNIEEHQETDAEEMLRTSVEEVNKLKHLKAKVWWDRITNYITIKKFDEQTAKDVVKKGNYQNLETYQAFLVSALIVDIDDVFAFIDSHGLLSKFSPQQIMGELYDLCIEVNPFLDYNNLTKKQHIVGKKSDKKQRTDNKTLNDISLDNVKTLAQRIKKRVIGQDHAIDTVTRAIKRAKIGIKDPAKPIGTFLFTGSTGIGKTETAKVLHQELMGKDGAFVRIDCSEYSADHEYSKLIGAPNGYIGFEDGGQLTNKLIENPFAVVLFDEIEKASSKVHQLLLQIMDDGIITDNHGVEVSFKDTIIIMTSNVGVDKVEGIKKRIGFGDVNVVNHEKQSTALEEAVKDTFKPEFINRINEVIHFKSIDKDACKEIIKLELNYLKKLLEPKNIMVEFTPAVRKVILEKGYSEEYGAREIKRTIEKVVSDSMADYMLDNGLTSNVILRTRVKNGKVIYSELPFGQILEAAEKLMCPSVKVKRKK